MSWSPPFNFFVFRRIIASFVAYIAFCAMATAQQHKVVAFDVESGLPQDYVYSLHQDDAGYLWIGTGDGLARYDGNTLEVFNISDSLCSNFISCSHSIGRDSWFGHNDGGISYYNGKVFAKLVEGEQGTGSITDIKSTGNIIWASTQSGGIWKIEPGLQPILISDPDNPVQIFNMEFLSSTECVVGSMDGVHIFAIENESNTLRFISILEGIPDTKVQDLMLSRNDSTLYIITEDEGIYTFYPRDLKSSTKPLELSIEAGIEGQQHIFEDSRGILWISTFGNGLYKLIPDSQGKYLSWSNINETKGLPGDNLKLVFEDREKNIWLGMYGKGLVRLVDEAFTFYSFDDAIGNNIHSIYTTDDHLWFGNENGLIKVNRKNGEVLPVSGPEFGLPDDRVTAIVGSPAGDLWIGTSQNGVFHRNTGDNRFQRIPISSGTLENTINAMAFRDSMVWIATNKGVCKIDDRTGLTTWFTISNAGLPHNTVNNLKVDASGKVWISTLSNSVSYIQDDSVTKLIIPTVGGALNIRTITEDPGGCIWIGTDGNGVFRMEGDSVKNYNTEDGLLYDFCNSLVGDDEEYIWVSHRGGLSRIRISDGFVSNLKNEVGIDQSMEFNRNAVFRDQKGIIWFGSSAGVLKYDPHLEKDQAPPPALSIVSVQVNSRAQELKDELRLPPGRHTIRIDFIGIKLENPGAVTYSYMMEGLDDSWSIASHENQEVFSKIPDGKYTFKLRAFNSEGTFDESPLKLYINISVPLWKRWWVYVIVVISVSIGIRAIIKRREYNLLLEKERLEKIVLERTHEVVEQKEEIEGQRDAIQLQNENIRLINQNITDSIIYASRIQKAVFPPVETLASIFPESFILNRPQYIVSGDFFWIANKKGKYIFTVTDCTGHGVPGAFMSMLGITLLNEIVNNQQCVEADEILNCLKNEIIRALRQKEGSDSASDGMDMALCVFDPSSLKLQYAGGFNPLVLIRDGELKRYQADPMPVGIGALSGRDFTRHELQIQKGDLIYLYSDGYEDQFGGEKDSKFSRKQFRELLMEIHTLPVNDQKTRLEERMDDWMDGYEQIDDIMVLGIKF